MKKILVLCSGNSSRSQMAEGYFNYYAQGEALFFSAGLEDRGVNPLTIQVMAEDNLDISESVSKKYVVFNGQKFDYLITVCAMAKKRLPDSIRAKKYLHFDIPDPDLAQGSPSERVAVFRQTREKVKKYVLKFIGKELSDTLEPVLI